MKYATSVLTFVTGAVAALLSYTFTSDVTQFIEILLLGAVFVAGLGLAVHGLFTGIEAAVAAGTHRPTHEDQQRP